MKLKLDENIPESLLLDLAPLGHDVETVRGEALGGRSDVEVWKAAQEEGRMLITQDLGFSDARIHAPGAHHGLILVRLRVPGRIALRRRICEVFATQPVENWRRCLVLVTDVKVRVRSPNQGPPASGLAV